MGTATLPAVYESPEVIDNQGDLVAEDEIIWGPVVLAIAFFGSIAAACRIICGSRRVVRCSATWRGLSVDCG